MVSTARLNEGKLSSIRSVPVNTCPIVIAPGRVGVGATNGVVVAFPLEVDVAGNNGEEDSNTLDQSNTSTSTISWRLSPAADSRDFSWTVTMAFASAAVRTNAEH